MEALLTLMICVTSTLCIDRRSRIPVCAKAASILCTARIQVQFRLGPGAELHSLIYPDDTGIMLIDLSPPLPAKAAP